MKAPCPPPTSCAMALPLVARRGPSRSSSGRSAARSTCELLAAQAREDSPITVLIAAFICLPGYLVGIIWYGLKYKAHSFDAEKIKQGLLFIPLVAMTMAWVPTILVPNTGIGLRLQIAGFSLVLTLLFGYIWIAIVRLSIAVFSRIELIKE